MERWDERCCSTSAQQVELDTSPERLLLGGIEDSARALRVISY